MTSLDKIAKEVQEIIGMLTDKINAIPMYESPKIPKKEKDALYEIFGSAGKEPKEFYYSDNKGRIRIENNSIVYFDVSEMHLEFLPSSIRNLKNLREAYFGLNKIKNVPEEIKKLSKLKRLSFTGNPLNQKSIEFLEKLKTEKKECEIFY